MPIEGRDGRRISKLRRAGTCRIRAAGRWVGMLGRAPERLTELGRPSGHERDRPESAERGGPADRPRPALGQVEGQLAGRAGQPADEAEQAPTARRCIRSSGAARGVGSKANLASRRRRPRRGTKDSPQHPDRGSHRGGPACFGIQSVSKTLSTLTVPLTCGCIVYRGRVAAIPSPLTCWALARARGGVVSGCDVVA